MKSTLSSLVIVLLGAVPAIAAAPNLGQPSPVGAQRGTEVELTFGGSRLADAQELLLYYPGIEVKQLTAVNDGQVKAKLAIAADCRLGIHAFRLRSATGISELRTFNVGALPEIAEKEPNNEFAAPQPIALGVTVNGVVQSEDVEYFVVEAKQGERITAEIEGIRLGAMFFDPALAILDEKRFELANSDDAAIAFQDSVVSIQAPKDGKYVIQLRESSFAGNGNCTYRLHVGKFPRPTATLPAGGKPGESLGLLWLGDPLGARLEQLTLPKSGSREFGLFAQDATGVSPSPNPFRLSDLPNVIEAEPNNARELANGAAAVPAAFNGVLAQDGDVDCYRFPAKKGQAFDVRVYARRLRSPLDSVLQITRSNGANVGANDDEGRQTDSYVRFTAPEDDQYVVTVNDQLKKGGLNYAYRVEVTPVKPRLTLGLPERQQYVDVTVSVPKANRTAFLVSAARADFGGELKIEPRDLPQCLQLETVTMAANQTVVPVLLHAAGDAPLAGVLSDVVGTTVDPNNPVEGHLQQDSLMVRGQNNVRVWGHVADRMALAVTEEAPFKIDIVEPKVPLVRQGAMDLKVVATRKEGFTAPIAVYMLYNPPGVGSSGSISIPEGKSEVTIPLNANNGAEIKNWKIVVMGQATVGNGPVLVSSQLANLEIADAYFQVAFNNTAVEQGQETEVVVKVAKNKDFEGAAKVELLGLPNEVTAEPLEFNKDSSEIAFKVKTTKASPAGRHKTLLCRAVVTQNGEPVTHMLGSGELRIDTPLPPKPNATAPGANAVAAKPAEKRLTRLEQLRLDREQAKQAQTTATAAPAESTTSTPAPATATGETPATGPK